MSLGLALLSAAPSPRALEHAISGHVNRVVRFASDGKGSDIQQLDGGASGTRIRWNGSGEMAPGIKARTLIEAGISSSDSFVVGLKDEDSLDALFIRHAALSFAGRWGQIGLGHTSEAFDSVAEADLSRTWLIDEPADDYTAAIAWRRGDGSTVTSAHGDALRVVDVRSDFDGFRRDVLRYDSPRFGTVQLIGSITNDNGWSVQGNVVAEIGTFELDARAGYTDNRQRTGFDGFTASASVAAANGLNLTMMYGSRDITGTGPDPDTFYIKGGYRWGNSGASFGWSTVRDLTEGVDSDRFSIGVVHRLPQPGIDLYANYQHYPGLDGIDDVESIDSFILGTRVAFD